jgi:tRNA-uridine 2-sulfurtransferase
MVAMSGGVDSSVAAALLLKEGYDVIGVTLRLWVDRLAEKRAGEEAKGCCSYDAVADARNVAASLGIPHYVFDMKEEFFQKVVCNFTEEYLRGRTPNPCIECNRSIKFSALRRKADGLGIGLLATGHYVRIDYNGNSGGYRLLKGVDSRKDQSYMLYILGQKDLASTLFPLGDKSKQQVRDLAAALGLKVAAKAESQEICFIPDNDYRSFMERTCPETTRPGDIVSAGGRTLGRHQGIAFYTVGQRKGLGLTTPEPYYVVEIDPGRNRIIVGTKEETSGSGLIAGSLNYISGAPPEKPSAVEVKIRYKAPAVPALLYPPRGDFARVIFDEEQKAVTPGQSAVFYCGEEVLGGGIIESAVHKDCV